MGDNSGFPIGLPGDVTARILDDAAGWEMMKGIVGRIFPHIPSMHFKTPAERQEKVAALKAKFARVGTLHIGFYNAAGEPVGWYYGYMEDEITHFIDTIGLLPEYQGKGIYTAFLKALISHLREGGFERLAVSHQPNNRGVMIPELKAGFNIVGLELNEQIGPNIKMVCLLHEDRRKGFEEVFSIAPQ